MIREIELKLVGAAAPERGDLLQGSRRPCERFAGAHDTDRPRRGGSRLGRGQSKQFMEEFMELRLRAVEAGSTVLRFAKGPVDKLDVDLPGGSCRR